MVYLLGEEKKSGVRIGAVVDRVKEVEGIDIVAWKESGEACIWSPRGELRFAPGSSMTDRRGESWDLAGSLASVEGVSRDNGLVTPAYPDVLGRVWSALGCDSTGEVLISAEAQYEFVDWGGADHVGGGSHGSLGLGDSAVPLVFYGCGPDLQRQNGDDRAEWSITDVAAVVLDHFGVSRP